LQYHPLFFIILKVPKLGDEILNLGVGSKVREWNYFLADFIFYFLVLINDFWDYLLDFLTPLGIGFRLEGY
jgi:hypothetical protein